VNEKFKTLNSYTMIHSNRPLLILSSILFLISIYSCTNNSTSTNNDEIETEFESTIRYDNSGAQAYLVTNIDGEGAFAELDSANPELTLTVGGRYTFINGAGASSHPLDFRNEEGAKLIGQSNNSGSFDSNEEVNLVREGDSISFTLIEELADELAEYICAFHPGMNGAITVSD
jgi:plastocyanin